MTMLLTKSAAKLDKSQNDDVLNVIQYLEPDYKPSPMLHAEAVKLFGAIVCPAAGNCRSVCLTRTGRMPMINSVQARLNRTDQLFTEPGLYLMQLKGEITQALGRAIKQNKKLAVRLNGTSDLDFRMIYEVFPQVQFFEYTKRKDLIIKNADIPNVHYTFSYSENAKTSVMQRVSNMGINISVVFKDKLPATYKGIKVINGDAHDRRFEDEQGVIVGLKFKGSAADKAIAIAGGFAI